MHELFVNCCPAGHRSHLTVPVVQIRVYHELDGIWGQNAERRENITVDQEVDWADLISAEVLTLLAAEAQLEVMQVLFESSHHSIYLVGGIFGKALPADVKNSFCVTQHSGLVPLVERLLIRFSFLVKKHL